MGTRSYLYGDSTDSGLAINYIELLRDFLDFAAQLMLSEHRIARAKIALESKTKGMVVEVDRMQSLADSVLQTLNQAKQKGSKSATEACIAVLERTTQDTLLKAVDGLKRELTTEESNQKTSQRRQRAANAKTIEYLLLSHELPDSKNQVNILLNSAGTGHIAEVNGHNAQGLQWRFSADIPENSNFSQLRKIAALASELTISLPEMTGLLRKSVKLKPYRVFPLTLCSFTHKGGALHMKLRMSPHPGDDHGLDIAWTPKSQSVVVVRVHKGESSDPYEVTGDDVQALVDIFQTVKTESSLLVKERSKLLDILFRQRPLAESEDPSALVKVMVNRLAPIIKGIVDHSLGDKELVLKKVLANGRREEVFAAKADLLDKLSILPTSMRSLFAPLCLGDLSEQIGDTTEIDIVDSSDTTLEIDLKDLDETPRTPLPSVITSAKPVPSQSVKAKRVLPGEASGETSSRLSQAPQPVTVSRAPHKRVAPKTKPPRNVKPADIRHSKPPVKIAAFQTKLPPPSNPVATSELLAMDEQETPILQTPLPRLKPLRREDVDSIDIALAGLEAEE